MDISDTLIFCPWQFHSLYSKQDCELPRNSELSQANFAKIIPCLGIANPPYITKCCYGTGFPKFVRYIGKFVIKGFVITSSECSSILVMCLVKSVKRTVR